MENSDWTSSRRQVLIDYYNLPEEAQQRADELFSRMNSLAATCADQAVFEQQLQTTGLANEYNNLLASFGEYAKIMIDGKEMSKEELLKEQKRVMAKSMAEGAVKSRVRGEVSAALTQVLPKEVNEVRLYGVRGLPIIGGILRRFEQLDALRWMFGFRKNKK